uniref:Uncharacterized protein n=1 Tax=viral metagenome TaxID=1070528 RepID=A0A6C0FB93_9ZZZZ|tara:strand:- start:2266 stop:2469 length:204 start_codon:yes stop_codon:yes gene_type:complete
MEALRKTTVDSKENLLFGENKSNKSNKCSLRIMKCLGIIIFLSGASALSFYMGMKYAIHLEDNSESF